MPGGEELLQPRPGNVRRLISRVFSAVDFKPHREQLGEQLGGRVKLEARLARRPAVAAEFAVQSVDSRTERADDRANALRFEARAAAVVAETRSSAAPTDVSSSLARENRDGRGLRVGDDDRQSR